jgi:hypothetical protein
MRSFLLDYLAPRLEDQEWLLLDEENLIKVRDETLFGLFAQRSGWGASFVFYVAIIPLYWPMAGSGAVGIGKRIGHWSPPRERLGEGWMDLGSPELAEHAASRLAPVINTQVAPWLAQFPTGKSVLQYEAAVWRHPKDPVFGWIRTGGSYGTDLLAYMWAWSGDRKKARSYLNAAIAGIRHQMAHVRREIARGRGKGPATPEQIQDEQNYRDTWEAKIAHLQQTLQFVERPEELRYFLRDTASSNRRELKVDRALPVSQVMNQRGGRQG